MVEALNEFRKPNSEDPFEKFIIEKANDDEWIVASTSIPYGTFEQRVYVVIDTDESEFAIYRISNPYGDFRVVREPIGSVSQLCADVVPEDAMRAFRPLTMHLPLDAALLAGLNGQVGIIYHTGVATEQVFVARTAGIGRPDDIVVAHAQWTGSDELMRRYGQTGMKAFEIGDNVRINLLMKMDVNDVASEVIARYGDRTRSP
jgi:hypothetical protein